MAPDDVRENLLLELFEALELVEQKAKPGREATYLYLAAVKDRLRQQRRMYVAVPGGDFAQHAPSAEELLVRAEHEALVDALPEALERVRPSLTKPTQQWVTALQQEAEGTSRALNLAQVARSVRKNRSSATRALAAVRIELERHGYKPE